MAEASTSDASLPTTVRGIVAARLDALPASERSLLLDAAVVGKTFWRGALERIAGESDGIPGLLGALEGRDLVVRETRSIIEGEQQYSFKHVLIREVAYELLPRARRQERHAAVARFFEDSTAELGEITTALARHWRDAGEPSRAVEYFIRAGESGRARLGEGPGGDPLPRGARPRARGRRRAPRRRCGAGSRSHELPPLHIPDARQLMR